METIDTENLIVRDEELHSQLLEELGKQGTNLDDAQNLRDVIQEVADEEGLTFEETLKLFKKGMKMMKGGSTKQPLSSKQKAKIKKNKKIAKTSKKRNRK